jgi:hypothetical protein
MGLFRIVATGGHNPITTASFREDAGLPGRDDRGQMTQVDGQHSRIAYCECGAQLQGDSELELFDAAQAHLAHHHPELLGAVGLDVVTQMAEERPGALSA